jgi:apolipoprotein N-acyltransferase
MIALACALLSGVMLYLSQGLNEVWWLAWIAPLPLLWLAYGFETDRGSRWRLFAASLAAWAAGQIYLVQCYWGVLPWFAIAPMIVGTSAIFALTVAGAGAAWRRLPPPAALFAFPVFWTSFEFLFSLVSPHGTFGSIAYSQVAWPPALQVASLLGLPAITFLLCLFASALAAAARGARAAGALAVGLCAAALLFGAVRLAQPSGPTVTVAALADWDGRLKASRKLDQAATHAMAERYAIAAKAQAQAGARLVVIPETALAADPAWRDAALRPLAEAARQARVTIVAGVIFVKPWRNAALTFAPDGTIAAYDKRHLLIPGEDRFVPGPGPGLLGNGRAVAICKDLDFPRTISADARQGVIRIMAVPANDFVKDGWIHARMAVMRGVENGFAVARAAFNGLETISDAQGRVLGRADTSVPGMVTLRAAVPLGPGPTLYARIGDVFAWLCVAGALALAAAAALGSRKPRE